MEFPIAETSLLSKILIALITTHITIISVTVFLHRNQAHGSLSLHPIASHFFRFWLWLTTGTVTKEWVAVHRKHHSTCETKNDPHSPIIEGIAKVFFGGFFLYKKESQNAETLKKYGRGTPNDFLEKALYSKYPNAGIYFLLILEIALFGTAGFVMWIVQMLWIPLWAAGVINGIGHYWGYRNYATPDASRNIVPWGIIVGGEELHNNHHALPASPKLSLRPWEFDIGWFYICVLRVFGLAKVKKETLLPVEALTSKKLIITDAKVLIANRLRMISRFGAEVLTPVIRDERKKSDKKVKEVLRSAQKYFQLHEGFFTPDTQEKIRETISKNKNIMAVCEFRKKLQAICKNPPSPQALVASLKNWCHEAEQSGIRALEEHAKRLRLQIG